MNEKINLTGCTSSTNINNINAVTSSSCYIWSGGWVTDNFESYYLDKNMIKHKKGSDELIGDITCG
jgi:hypothetical protein